MYEEIDASGGGERFLRSVVGEGSWSVQLSLKKTEENKTYMVSMMSVSSLRLEVLSRRDGVYSEFELFFEREVGMYSSLSTSLGTLQFI